MSQAQDEDDKAVLEELLTSLGVVCVDHRGWKGGNEGGREVLERGRGGTPWFSGPVASVDCFNRTRGHPNVLESSSSRRSSTNK